MLEGHSRREARDRTRALGALLAASVNHALSLRKTFWVDDALAAKLEHTRLDVHGADLNLPFPSCAFVLTEPTALSLARQLVRLDPNWRQTERVSVITAYLARTADGAAPAPNDAATLHVQLALSPWGRTIPWIRPHFRGPREAVLIEREYRVGEATVDHAHERGGASGASR